MNAPRRCDPAEVIALNAQGLTQKQIGDLVGIKQCSVSELLKRHGVPAFRQPGPVRKYFYNEEYFATVETPDQAYWVGFLAADGCVLKVPCPVLGLGIGVKDVEHLKLFRSALGADNVPITHEPRPGNSPGICNLRLNSARLVEDVARYGVIPRKSKYCKPWPAPSDLAPHYWRGCVDGDGHVAASGTYMSFCGTQAMVEGFRSFAAGVCDTRASPLRQGNLWMLHVQGRRKVHAMLSALYQPDAVGLARKKERALLITADSYRPRTSPPCHVEKCPNLSIARGLCGKHYQRWKKHGDPLITRLDRGADGRFRAA